MAKENFNNHPILNLLNKFIRNDNRAYRPFIILRGYIIEKSVVIDGLMDSIILRHIFNSKEEIVKELVSKSLYKGYQKVISENTDKTQRKLEGIFYQEHFSDTGNFWKRQYLQSILDDIEFLDETTLKNYDTFHDTLKEFFETRNTVAHYKWSTIKYNENYSSLSYVKLGGEIVREFDNDKLTKFNKDFNRLNNNLSVIWFSYFNKE